MKKFIILSIFAVITACFAKSYAADIPAIDKTLKVEKTVNADVIFVSSAEVDSPDLVFLSNYDSDSPYKIKTLDEDHKITGILTDEFKLKHPKRIHESKYSGYQERLCSYSNRIYVNRIFLHSHNKVRFNS